MVDGKTIGVVGLWHLGCVVSSSWAKLGTRVIGFDYNNKIIEDLNKNIPPIFEPNLAEEISKYRANDKLIFTSDINLLKNCDYIFLAFDTPVSDNDEIDMTCLIKAIYDLKEIMKDNAVVIVSSQVPVGTCGEFRSQLQKQNSSLELVCSPENLRLGSAIECYLKPGRIILGADSNIARTKAEKLFNYICSDVIPMNLVSAEMTKHALNSFLANSVVFANNLADLCEVSGANILNVMKGLKSDERIGQRAYLSPGIGFSGGTLGRDLRILSKLNLTNKRKATLYESLYELNANRKYEIVAKIIRCFGENVVGKSISILGLTYKPDTSTLRRSLPIEIVKLLAKEGVSLKVYDPKADYSECTEALPFQICSTIDEVIKNTDMIVLMTEWKEFATYDWDRGVNLVREKNFFDTKNFLNSKNLDKVGFNYFGVGI